MLLARGAALKAATIVIMQRLHQRDLSGHILEQGGDWVHLCLPMRAEPRRMVTTPIGFNDPRAPGELLWPGLFPEKTVLELETMGSYRAACQLQQRPTPASGGILKRHWWKYYNASNMAGIRLDRIVISLDPALKAKQRGDYFVFQVWGSKGPDRFYLKKDKGRWSESECVERAEALYTWARSTWNNAGIVVAIENTAAGPEVIARLRRLIPGVKAINVGGRRRDSYSGDKEARAHAASPALEAGNVFAPGAPGGSQSSYDETLTPAWVQDTIDECAGFPNATFDDEVDAFVIAQLELERGTQTLMATVEPSRDAAGARPSSALLAIRRRKARATAEANA